MSAADLRDAKITSAEDAQRMLDDGRWDYDDSAADCARSVIALRAEIEALRAIIEGRTTPPSDEEIIAHHAAGGSWLHAYGRTHDVIDVMRVASNKRDGLAAHGIASTWWALDAQSRPCAWPVAEVSR